jgi:D-beta-D-heptose 7-phosphate kinase/D-beta-D-heptose 1-phosphate adenosyltransferase
MSSIDVLERVRSIHGEAIAVVGDLMLDRFVWGRVSRISPEAPVPVVEIERESFHLGGAANVARNLSSLGATPLLLGVVGDDDASSQLRQTLRDRALSDDTVLTDATRRTTVKTRIIAGSQQVVRADWESVDDLSGEVESRALDALDDIIGRARAVVLSDYAKGTLTPRIIERAIELAHQHDLPILVDPKLRRYRLYQGVTLVTPNLHEATRFAGIAVVTDNDIAQAAETILNDLSCTAVLITRGEQGMTLFETGASPHHIETFAREVFDVSGAGDTVIAAAALALAAGATLAEAAELANRAAGVVVGKLGTATVELEEL